VVRGAVLVGDGGGSWAGPGSAVDETIGGTSFAGLSELDRRGGIGQDTPVHLVCGACSVIRHLFVVEEIWLVVVVREMRTLRREN